MNGQGSIGNIYAFSRHFYPNRLTKKRINIQATHKDPFKVWFANRKLAGDDNAGV